MNNVTFIEHRRHCRHFIAPGVTLLDYNRHLQKEAGLEVQDLFTAGPPTITSATGSKLSEEIIERAKDLIQDSMRKRESIIKSLFSFGDDDVL